VYFSCFRFLQAGRLTQDVSIGSDLFVRVIGESLAELSSSTSTFEVKFMFFRWFLQDTRSFSFDVGLCWVLSVVVFFFIFLEYFLKVYLLNLQILLDLLWVVS
jgi:hypothetical protein